MSAQKPLELILARNLLSSVTTPAFLVGDQGALLYYNEAAGAMLGRGFEESANMTAQEWTEEFGPFGPDDVPFHMTKFRLLSRFGTIVPITETFESGPPVAGTRT